MVMGCYVVGCKSRKRKTLLDYISFHKFPSDKALNHKWMVAAGRVDSKRTKSPRICSMHFTTDCFKRLKNSNRTFLARDSVPTLNVFDASTVLAHVNTENIKRNLNVGGTKRKRKVDIYVEATANGAVDSDIDRIDEANSEICNLSEIETDAKESNVKPKLNLKVDDTLPPETRILIFKLQRKAQVAVSQKKTINKLRSMVFRLRKKNEELTAAIEIMKNESLRGHTGPSILLVGL